MEREDLIVGCVYVKRGHIDCRCSYNRCRSMGCKCPPMTYSHTFWKLYDIDDNEAYFYKMGIEYEYYNYKYNPEWIMKRVSLTNVDERISFHESIDEILEDREFQKYNPNQTVIDITLEQETHDFPRPFGFCFAWGRLKRKYMVDMEYAGNKINN